MNIPVNLSLFHINKSHNYLSLKLKNMDSNRSTSLSNLRTISKQNPFHQPSAIKCASTVTDHSTNEPSCQYGTLKYFALCGLGGILSCGPTHTAVVPLDVAKCKIQVQPDKYKNTFQTLRLVVSEEGARGLVRGWAPTLIGYSMQGLFKFGLYETFKVLYSDLAGTEKAYLYRTLLYLSASASAEIFADIALAPMEAVKVRMQTQPGWASTLREGAPKLWAAEGLAGFYKGLPPLWFRQVPYTMMKFACFERTLEFFYKHVIPYPRDTLGKPTQLVVTFTSGYIAGIFCTIVSHPFDTVVSKLNSDVGSSAWESFKGLGLRGMWKGVGPRLAMVGTLTAAQWLVYDSFKIHFRIPRPPPPVIPESLRVKQET